MSVEGPEALSSVPSPWKREIGHLVCLPVRRPGASNTALGSFSAAWEAARAGSAFRLGRARPARGHPRPRARRLAVRLRAQRPARRSPDWRPRGRAGRSEGEGTGRETSRLHRLYGLGRRPARRRGACRGLGAGAGRCPLHLRARYLGAVVPRAPHPGTPGGANSVQTELAAAAARYPRGRLGVRLPTPRRRALLPCRWTNATRRGSSGQLP